MSSCRAGLPVVLIILGVLKRGGGAERVAATLATQLSRRGYVTHLLTFYDCPETYPHEGVYHTFGESFKRNRFEKLLGIPLRLWRIARFVRAHNVEVAVSFLEEANFYMLVVKLLAMPSLPVIVSVRNNINKCGRHFWLLMRLLYPHAKRVVSVTKAVELMLKNELSLSNTTTIYNPIDSNHVTRHLCEPLPPEYAWIAEKRPLLISAGRLAHQKGQWHLIRAFSKVVAHTPQATLIILGEGEYRKQLGKLTEACGLSDNVFLLGQHRNVYPFLAAADLFVFSSLFEGMPNTMLEAYSVGLPIVSTDCVSGPREIIAPKVGVTESISYPYETPHGILTRVPDKRPPVWQPPSVVPLTAQEIGLAEAVNNALARNRYRGQVRTPRPRGESGVFDIATIMQQWERLLS